MPKKLSRDRIIQPTAWKNYAVIAIIWVNWLVYNMITRAMFAKNYAVTVPLPCTLKKCCKTAFFPCPNSLLHLSG
mgnify:CR=1 FL=1